MTMNGQHKENESDCRKVVQQLVSSIPHSVLMGKMYKEKEQEIGTLHELFTAEGGSQDRISTVQTRNREPLVKFWCVKMG